MHRPLHQHQHCTHVMVHAISALRERLDKRIENCLVIQDYNYYSCKHQVNIF